jgi:hypothetical protein
MNRYDGWDYAELFPDDGRYPYQQMKDLQAELNADLPRSARWTLEGERSILAMARGNDPFYSGQGSQRELAEWFADLFNSCGFSGAQTFRFVHYVAVGDRPNPATGVREPVLWPDGRPYENTVEDFAALQDAGRWARNMGLIDPYAVYSRKAEVFDNTSGLWVPTPSVGIMGTEPHVWFSVGLQAVAEEEGHSVHIHGYEASRSLQPSVVEVWAEKSVDEQDHPLLAGVCRREGANLVVGEGFARISDVYTMLRRRMVEGKALRILYLSDFDPAGRFIALSPARAVEFAIRRMVPRPDVRLKPLALHREQVEDLELPRKPIKRSDLRRLRFEAKHGEGAVELNTLFDDPTIAPLTREMLTDAIRSLRDPQIGPKVRLAATRAKQIAEADYEARASLPRAANREIARRANTLVDELRLHQNERREGIDAEIGEIQEEIMRLTADLRQQRDELRGERDALDAEIEAEIAPFQERAERVRLATRRRLEGFGERFEPVEEGEEPEAGKVAIPALTDLAREPEEAAENWAYDSRRDYFEQLAMYKRSR